MAHDWGERCISEIDSLRTDDSFFIAHNPVKFIALHHVEAYLIGAVAAAGYIINVPLFYYFIEGKIHLLPSIRKYCLCY